MIRQSFSEYDAIQAINWSRLALLYRGSPKSYRYHRDHPTERTDSPSMTLGRYTHSLVFESELAATDYAVMDELPDPPMDRVVIWEGGDRRGKAWQDFKAAHEGMTVLKPSEVEGWKADEAARLFVEANAGRELVSPRDAEVAREMATAIRESREVMSILRFPGVAEETVMWTDPATGLPCKARLDWRVRDYPWIVDLKTARSIEEHAFWYQAAKLGYHCQMAHYANGYAATHDGRIPEVYLIVVESTPPYDVGVLHMTSMDLGRGREVVAELMETLKTCAETDTWPGRYSQIMQSRLPSYLFPDEIEGDIE